MTACLGRSQIPTPDPDPRSRPQIPILAPHPRSQIPDPSFKSRSPISIPDPGSLIPRSPRVSVLERRLLHGSVEQSSRNSVLLRTRLASLPSGQHAAGALDPAGSRWIPLDPHQINARTRQHLQIYQESSPALDPDGSAPDPTRSHQIPPHPTTPHHIPPHPTTSHHIPPHPTRSHQIPLSLRR